MIGPELRDPPYKSLCWADVGAHAPWRMWFDGGPCDHFGCLEPSETPNSRFCEVHRREHGERLQGQLREIVRQQRQRRRR